MRRAPAPDMPLYPTDEEIARALFGDCRETVRAFVAQMAIEERYGFPKKSQAFFGRRYWPAVLRYLETRDGAICETPLPAEQQENWNHDRRPRSRKTATR
jgi:hypothetical protein